MANIVRDSHFGHFMNTLNPAQFTKKKDFVNVHDKNLVREELMKNGDTKFDGDCMSDFIFLYDKKLKKKRLTLVVTENHIYVFDYRNWKLVFMNELQNLSAVSIASKNCTLLSMHFVSGGDLMLESYRRIDIILYCARNLKEANLNLFRLKIRKNFKGSSSKADDDAPMKDIPTKDIERAKKSIEAGFLQETIRNSKKSGYLRLMKKGLFGGSSFSEHFFVLSDLGLVCFKRFGDKKPVGFMPVLGGNLKVYPKATFGKDYVLGIKFADEETLLQAASKVELDDWMKQIKDLQDKCLTAKDTIKEIGKVL